MRGGDVRSMVEEGAGQIAWESTSSAGVNVSTPVCHQAHAGCHFIARAYYRGAQGIARTWYETWLVQCPLELMRPDTRRSTSHQWTEACFVHYHPLITAYVTKHHESSHGTTIPIVESLSNPALNAYFTHPRTPPYFTTTPIAFVPNSRASPTTTHPFQHRASAGLETGKQRLPGKP